MRENLTSSSYGEELETGYNKTPRQLFTRQLFFKWLKQHVEIKHFYGMSETAIQNQIFLALIAYCLHVLIQLEMRSKKSLLRISRWLNKALWKPAYIWIRRFDDRSIP